MSARDGRAPEAPRARTCPARSPETRARCVLPDTWRAHEDAQGCHESERVECVRAVWARTWVDVERWARTEPEALAYYLDARAREHATEAHKRPKRGCPECIDDTRIDRAQALTSAPAGEIRRVLAADDLVAPLRATGGLLPGAATGPVIYGGSPPPTAAALLDEAALIRARQMRAEGGR